jgi:hypothetical protein
VTGDSRTAGAAGSTLHTEDPRRCSRRIGEHHIPMATLSGGHAVMWVRRQ